jgi:predicted ATP-dependent serine protease
MKTSLAETSKEDLSLNVRVPTGIDGLDPLIEGGFPRNSLILLAGNPGVGKTVFGAQFLFRGAKDYGENGLYVSFAESEDVLIRNIGRHLRSSPQTDEKTRNPPVHRTKTKNRLTLFGNGCFWRIYSAKTNTNSLTK